MISAIEIKLNGYDIWIHIESVWSHIVKFNSESVSDTRPSCVGFTKKKTENFAYGEINERSFSKTTPALGKLWSLGLQSGPTRAM